MICITTLEKLKMNPVENAKLIKKWERIYRNYARKGE